MEAVKEVTAMDSKYPLSSLLSDLKKKYPSSKDNNDFMKFVPGVGTFENFSDVALVIGASADGRRKGTLQ